MTLMSQQQAVKAINTLLMKPLQFFLSTATDSEMV